MRARTSYRAGFTMIEMLTVIAIIAILAAILFPVFANVRNRVHESRCLNNLHQVAQAVNLYQDTFDKYPVVLNAAVFSVGGQNIVLSPLYPQFLKSADALHCPVAIYRDH